ncbi:hypothetical protein M8J77_021554 [Diaphorina citri]|nr:hypothetical protein M8J77_021554 [Diaphorina citri]
MAATSTTTANPGMNWIYQAPQILIPPQLPLVLKQYIKAAIRTQPHDLLTWSAYYFKCMHQGLVPPVKKHLEFPLFAGPGSFTPGFLHVLINQLGREGYVPTPLLYEKWLGLTLNKGDLDRMLLLRHYRGKVDIAEFVAIAAGHLCKTLAATMTLVCELLTLEPEGACAKIPLPWFNHLYTLLAELDCAPARQDEIVVQDIILPFGERESKLWSIPDGVSPEIRDFIRKHFQTVESDILGEEEEGSLSMSSCVDMSRICHGKQPDTSEEAKDKPKRTKRKKVPGQPEPYVRDSFGQVSADGLQVWDDQCNLQDHFTLDICSENAPSENLHVEENQENEVEDVVKPTEENAVSPEEQKAEAKPETPKQSFELGSVQSLVALPKMEAEIDHEVPSLRSGPCEADVCQYSDVDRVPSELLHYGSLQDVREGEAGGEGVEESLGESDLSRTDDQSRITLKTIGEILLRYHVPGIGPKIPQWQIEQVLSFMLVMAQKQDGYVMPRNIQHRNCPPLDKLEESISSDKADDSNYNSLNSGDVRF